MPHYYSESVRVLGPLMEQAMEKAHATATLVAHNTNRLILWVRESTPLLIEWVGFPPLPRTLIVTVT